MKHTNTFDFNTKDIHGLVPDLSLIDTVMRHTGNNKLYTLQDFAWNGATDEWGFLCAHGEAEPEVWRPLEHMYGNRENGEPRYIFRP